ncbi:ribonuclease P protein component [Cryomorpha ignava]|uniref:Ribonuclease P protein component n=1 Tax=Cryomorpha ignava TaxID=101383 RepID=A0A7K3WPD1_9FLAO|nr:ribonuclease P protein component [Cryomorpha ignava]NEN23519.1 ribonuclease P protein component [Cryomorpha ignava]
MSAFSFPKSERICNKHDIDLLFENGASVRDGSIVLRFAFRESVENELTQKVLVVVPKKRVRRAVDRNKLKRQIREIYRLNKINQKIEAAPGKTILIAIIYTGKPEAEYAQIEKNYLQAGAKIKKELTRGTG